MKASPRPAAALLVGARAQRNVISCCLVGLVAALAIVSIDMAVAEDLAAHWTNLEQSADVIVIGECAAERSDKAAAGDLITTTIEFRAHRFFKGEPVAALTVKTLGGRVGNETVVASHGASLAAGEQVLLFLKRSEFGPYYVIAGGDAGKLVVQGLADELSGTPTTGTRAELMQLLRGSDSEQ